LPAVGLVACMGTTESKLNSGQSGPDVVSQQPNVPLQGVTTFPETPPPFEPPPLRMRVLVSVQYENAVRDLLGTAAANAVTPPADSELNGYNSIGASQFVLSPLAVVQYEKSAYAAAKAALANTTTRGALIGCTPSSATDDACWNSFVQGFGKLAWRGQITSTDVSALVTLGKNAATAVSDFYGGAEHVIAAFLQSSRFLYQVETGTLTGEKPGMKKLTGVELASRLSFLLFNSAPSQALLDAAGRGDLDTVEGLRAQVARLLTSSGGKVAAEFFDEWLDLLRLPQLEKNAQAYPQFTPALASDMAQETRMFVTALTAEDADFRTALDADFTYVSPALATLYKVTSPSSGFVKTTLPANSQRGGLLGQASFLSLFAHNDSSSPTLRGKFVREQFMCQSIPPPPPDVVTVLPEVDPNNPQTARQRLAIHRSNSSCAGCHVLMDDIGLGLENFDSVGAYRTTEYGITIDANSTLDSAGAFAGAKELGSLLKTQDRVHECTARNLFRYAMGHLETNGEIAPLKSVYEAYASSGFKFKTLVTELVVSDAFRYAGVEP
jgi:hypothetical protein